MGLKLPKIEQRVGPAMPSIDVRAPLRVAAAASSSGKAILGLAERYKERENQREWQEAVLAVNKSDTDFVAAYGGKEEYAVDSIDDTNFLESTRGLPEDTTSVPAYQVYPDWRSRNYKQAIDEASKKISNVDLRNKFLAQQMMKQQNAFVQDSVQASKTQINYMAKQTATAVNQNLEMRNYDGAKEAVYNSGLSESRQQEMIFTIDKRKQYDGMSQVLENGRLQQVRDAITLLETDDKDTTGLLSQKEQTSFMSSLRRREKAIVDSNKKVNTQAIKLIHDQSKNMLDAVNNGYKVDQASYEKNMALIAPKYPVLAKNMQQAWDMQPVLEEFRRLAPSVQMGQWKKAEKESRKLTGQRQLDAIDKAEAFKKAYYDGVNQREKDTMGWALRARRSSFDSLDMSSIESFAASLKARVPIAKDLQLNYGTFTGFLTQEELHEFGSRIENASNTTKLLYINAINKTLGSEAGSFYTQLEKYGVAGSTPAAGEIAARGGAYTRTAELILKGSVDREDNELTKIFMKETRSEMESFINENFGNLYGGSAQTQTSMVSAFKDLYSQTRNLEATLRQLTGGTVSYNGYDVVAPRADMTGLAYKQSIQRWPKEVWADPEFKADGFTGPQLRQQIIEGRLVQVGISPGRSYLAYSEDPMTRVESSPGVPYVFRFNDMDKRAAIEDLEARLPHKKPGREGARKAELRQKFIDRYSQPGNRTFKPFGGE
ncbi:MAG: hypothetical protein ACPKM1_15675 [Spirochaetaceae bacterium]